MIRVILQDSAAGSRWGHLLGCRAFRIAAISHSSYLAGKHGATKDFLKTGDEFLAALTEADASQEHQKASIPKEAEEFMIEKARPYFLLKQINRAGEALWMDDPGRKDAYDIQVLHRRGTKKANDEAPSGTAGPEANAYAVLEDSVGRDLLAA